MAITVGSTSTPTTGLLTSLGVGSGLDVANLVSQLVAAKKAPQQNQITSQTNTANTQLSALGQVSAALSALQSAMAPLTDGSAFTARAVSSSDTTVLGASATGTPVNGSYNIVVTQLASALKASSGAFASSSAAVGTGTLTIAVGSQSMSLTLDSTNNSLAAIRDAINGASTNPGVSATIVTGTDGAHLVLSGTRTGAANGFSVSSSGGDGKLAALKYDPAASSGNGLSVVTAAADAKYSIDGLAASSAGNTVSSAIDGLTLNLVKAGSSTLSVTSDTSKATSALTNLVNTYNGFVGIYQNLTRYDATSGTAGALLGDATLNSINNTLSSIIGGTANGASLSSIGISLQVDGTLKLDSGKLATALGDGGKQVGALFGGTNGFAAKLNAPLTSWVGSQGVLASRTSSIGQQLSDLANQQTALNSRMDSLTALYKAQFTALDTLMSKLNSTSTYLQQQFDALTAANKK
ncbi:MULTISPECIES: flagellar filament capping protein FliD [unclassified Rhodanobacter]|uniref:flagellar filament capping protein FliD n=1 Tax=unclassified Rhodanobacter TaxID=2621553 RepID=UPI0007AA3E53|nr:MULTISPECIES: flagellar filament capping protein FliD [unclassified Rhodanobacter]KZC16055.1 flagellar hook protein [Rhodanobacter sp. FW104-R8]KZC26646.1 flagellar hook protein [Rhodanobacter sp. FW510-T8]KZC30523.1 flagellar hook protein [Rhodanobacter sp. FW510-R10]